MIFIAAGLSACMKGDTFNNTTTGTTTTTVPLTPAQAARQAVVDDSLINVYLVKNKINAIKDPSGLYYQITTPGAGVAPSVNSTITAGYTGTTLDGKVFDQNPSATFLLSNLILGWQYGVPLIKTGGTIVLYLPSALGYSNSVQGVLPANSVLIFNISLFSSN